MVRQLLSVVLRLPSGDGRPLDGRGPLVGLAVPALAAAAGSLTTRYRGPGPPRRLLVTIPIGSKPKTHQYWWRDSHSHCCPKVVSYCRVSAIRISLLPSHSVSLLGTFYSSRQSLLWTVNCVGGGNDLFLWLNSNLYDLHLREIVRCLLKGSGSRRMRERTCAKQPKEDENR